MSTVIELLRAIDQLNSVLHHIPVDDVENGEALTVAIDAMNAELLRVQQDQEPKPDRNELLMLEVMSGTVYWSVMA